MEFEQIANQAAKLKGFVGECVRERAVKRKEVLAATQAKVYMTNILFMSFAKSFTFIPRYSCHNFFRT